MLFIIQLYGFYRCNIYKVICRVCFICGQIRLSIIGRNIYHRNDFVRCFVLVVYNTHGCVLLMNEWFILDGKGLIYMYF